jgi:predicted ATPase
MKIESIRLKNFKTFRSAEFYDLPGFAVIVGANGTGKSTIFEVFGFLRDAMSSNVNAALAKLGGSRGFKEVRSRNTDGPIEIEIKFRPIREEPLITYYLEINENKMSRFSVRMPSVSPSGCDGICIHSAINGNK